MKQGLTYDINQVRIVMDTYDQYFLSTPKSGCTITKAKMIEAVEFVSNNELHGEIMSVGMVK